MSNKKETKATAAEEAAEQEFLAKQAGAAKKPKAKATTAEGDIQPREGEEFLPPPDPPVVPSLPTPPAAPDAVDTSEKGAQPEDHAAVRELVLAPEWERPVEPPPEIPPP